MTTKTKTPNTAAHTRDMLESILRPHSLEELHALVGGFPFKAVKVCNPAGGPDLPVSIPVGGVENFTRQAKDGYFVYGFDHTAQLILSTPGDLKQWRLAE